jgi:hypothetical protein
MSKQKNVEITDANWKLAKKAALKSAPTTTRPRWINHAIIEQAKRENVK